MSHRHSDYEEQEGYLASVSDLMVGFLFVFIIILMTVALRLKAASEELDKVTRDHEEVVNELTSDRERRSELLNKIKKSLEKKGIQVHLTPRKDGILLPEETLFRQGMFELDNGGLGAVSQLAGELIRTLPCVLPETNADLCPRGHRAPTIRLDSVQVEGHSDSTPVGMAARYKSNWELSHLRAESTFRGLLEAQPELSKLINIDGMSLFSMGAYGATRPLEQRPYQTLDQWYKSNRRIEVRFNLASPKPRQENSIISKAPGTES